MSQKCYRCGNPGHVRVNCPWNLSNQPTINQDPDLSRAHAYWDLVAPLPQPKPDKNMTLVQVARERRLRAIAAEQVAESRAARAMI